MTKLPTERHARVALACRTLGVTSYLQALDEPERIWLTTTSRTWDEAHRGGRDLAMRLDAAGFRRVAWSTSPGALSAWCTTTFEVDVGLPDHDVVRLVREVLAGELGESPAHDFCSAGYRTGETPDAALARMVMEQVRIGDDDAVSVSEKQVRAIAVTLAYG